MAETIERLSSGTIAGGAVIDALNAELQKAFDNIIDPNTEAKRARTVTLTIKIEPNDIRSEALVTFTATSKLCPTQAVAVEVSIRDQKGEAIVSEGPTLSLPMGAKG